MSATAVKRSNTVTIDSKFPWSYSYGYYYACVDHCYISGDACMRACVMRFLRVRVRVCTGLPIVYTINSTRLLRVGKDTYITFTLKYFSIFIPRIYIPERWLYFRPLTGRTSFAQLQALPYLAQLQALLGHSSSSTSNSTSKSVDPQQQYQHLECVACSSPCPCFLHHKL